MSVYVYICKACQRWFKSDEITTSIARCPHCGGRAS